MRVLYLEDSQDDVDLLKHALVRQGFDVVARRVDTEPDFLDALSEGGWDVVLSDHLPIVADLRLPEVGLID